MNWYKKAQINSGKIKLTPDGGYAILGKNTKPGEGPWRISYIDENKKPKFHQDYLTYEEAEIVFNYTAGVERNIYELV